MGQVLPQEIITDILTFLPVKSLIRFQCVCKLWKNLIKTPSFIAAHLHHSIHRRPCLLFERHPIQGRNHTQLYLLDCEPPIVKVQNIPVVNGRLHIVGSCDGLLCLQIEKMSVSFLVSSYRPSPLLLWNPSLREVRQVTTTFPDFVGNCNIGFGFCPIVKDYKIVRLYVSGYDGEVHLVEVYSLGMGSWKEIEVGNSLRDLRMPYDSFTVNGAIFWFGVKRSTLAERVIVSFDIATEVFTLIPVPVTLVIPVPGRTFIPTEFEHRLALLSSTRNEYKTSCLIELWVLEDGTGVSRERWSWAKKYTSKPHPCSMHPNTIWRNEIACLVFPPIPDRIQMMTALSNFTNTELKVLSPHYNYIFNYVESLVPVNNIHIEK
ncbi:hypothetical protein K1719_022603 [Acacia pycnantha]|nr:hypothetical protein K1719_022603 [Acacia pycnantha]